jgi:hypothetical protein
MDLSETSSRVPPVALDWVPADACTLPTRERPLRVAEFDDLFATALRAVERPSGAITRGRLVLAGAQGLAERVERLSAAEGECCSFFTFTLTQPAGEKETVVLDIEVPAPQADVLAGLLDRAEQIRGAAG